MKNHRPKKNITTPATREPRIEVHGTVGVEVRPSSGGMGFCGWVKNLNTGGMSIWSDERLPEDLECEFDLHLPNGGGSVEGRGWVVYSNGNGMAIQFDAFSPENLETMQRFLIGFVVPSVL